jgi:hypothetical protein
MSKRDKIGGFSGAGYAECWCTQISEYPNVATESPKASMPLVTPLLDAVIHIPGRSATTD